MQADIITSEKALMRAIAVTIVNNKKEIAAIFKKNGINKKEFTSKEILRELSENKEFAKEFTKLMTEKGYLKNVNEDGSYHNVIAAAISGIISAVGNVAGKALGNKQLQLEGQNMERQAQIDAENQMVQMIQQQQVLKQKKETTKMIIISVSLLVMLGTVFFIIKNK